MATGTPLPRFCNTGKGTSRCFPAPHSIPAWTTGSPTDRSSSRAPCSRPRRKSVVCPEASSPRWEPRFDLWRTFWSFCLYLHDFSFCHYYHCYCCWIRTSTKSMTFFFFICNSRFCVFFSLKIALSFIVYKLLIFKKTLAVYLLYNWNNPIFANLRWVKGWVDDVDPFIYGTEKHVGRFWLSLLLHGGGEWSIVRRSRKYIVITGRESDFIRSSWRSIWQSVNKRLNFKNPPK